MNKTLAKASGPQPWLGAAAISSALVFVASLVLCASRQAFLGAWRAEWQNDDVSHYVTGLMFHDYLAAGLPGSPLAYLIRYQAHYPLVGIGHWPPLFYGVMALWMLIAGTGLVASMLLTALVVAGLAALAWHLASRVLGRGVGLFVVAGVLLDRLVVQGSLGLMLDLPAAVVMLVATLFYARYLATGRARDSVLFGVAAAAAILTKGNGMALALLPVAAVLIGRRFDLPLRLAFWLPAPIVAVLAGPWTLATYDIVAQGFRYNWGLHYAVVSLSGNLAYLVRSLGWVGTGFTLIGLGAITSTAWRKRASGGLAETELVAMAALFVSVFGFQSAVPAALQGRYLMPATVPALMLAAAGATWLAQALGQATRARAVLLALILGLVAWHGLAVPFKHRLGFADAARLVWAHRIPTNPVVLVATDDKGEGVAVSQLARLDPHRPSLFVIRGSRLLGAGGYNNAQYMPRFAHAAQAMAAIDRYGVPLVLLQARAAGNSWRHLDQIEALLRRYPQRFVLIGTVAGRPEPISLYRVVGNAARAVSDAKLIRLSGPHSFPETGAIARR